MKKTNWFVMRPAHYFFLFLLPLVSYPALSTTPRPVAPTHSVERARSHADFGKLPLAFETNRGQTNPQVKFLARGKGYALFLTREEAMLKLTGRGTPTSTLSDPAVLRMKLMGANPRAAVIGARELPGKSNYFIGNDPKQWRADIPTYARVQYQGIYPGVDLVYYGTQGQLECDFVVAPGADPGRIAWQFDGATAKLAANGDLLLVVPGGKNVPDGELRFHRPVVYQKIGSMRQPVTGSYKLSSANRVTFVVANYDRRRALVIDPLLVYSTYLGGSLTNYGYAIAVDSAGSAYVTGETISVNFPTKNPIETYHAGGFCVTGSPCPDAFVTKFNATGTALVYSTYLGGSSADTAFGIAVDSAKNAYVVGRTYSNDFPTTAGVLRTFCGELMVNNQPTSTCNGNVPDAFVTKINAAGSAILYSTFLGGTFSDFATAVAVDSAGDAYVAGQTYSPLPTGNPNDPGFPVTGATAFQPKFVGVGPPTSFFVELNPTASSELYGTFFGSENPAPAIDNSSQASGIAVDKSGKAYVSGNTRASDFPTTAGAFQTSCAPLRFGQCAGLQGFVGKFDPSLSQKASLVYATYLAGTSGNTEPANAIAVDSAGSAYVTGQAISADFPTTPGAFQTTCAIYQGGCVSAYVTKFNPTGTALVYSTLLGDNIPGPGQIGNSAFGLGIQVDAKKNAYVTGGVSEGNEGVPSFPMVNPIRTVGGAFVSEFNPAGSALLFSTHFGGGGLGAQGEHPNGIAVDGKGGAYVVGQTSLLTFPTTPGAFQTASGGVNGTWQGFVFKIATFAADLSITNTAPATVNSGSNLTYVIGLTNNGPDTASTVAVSDTTPTGTTFVSVTTTAGICSAPAVGGTGKVMCKVSSLANAGSLTINLTVKVTAGSGSTIKDTASVTSITFDPNTKNNSAKAQTSVN